MREACRVTNLVYKEIEKVIKPGMSTLELDKFAERIIKENGGIPAQKGYPSGMKGVPNFPSTLCVSINDEVIHGIPSDKKIIRDAAAAALGEKIGCPFYLTSAADGTNVVRIFEELIKLGVEHKTNPKKDYSEKILDLLDDDDLFDK